MDFGFFEIGLCVCVSVCFGVLENLTVCLKTDLRIEGSNSRENFGRSVESPRGEK